MLINNLIVNLTLHQYDPIEHLFCFVFWPLTKYTWEKVALNVSANIQPMPWLTLILLLVTLQQKHSFPQDLNVFLKKFLKI